MKVYMYQNDSEVSQEKLKQHLAVSHPRQPRQHRQPQTPKSGSEIFNINHNGEDEGRIAISKLLNKKSASVAQLKSSNTMAERKPRGRKCSRTNSDKVLGRKGSQFQSKASLQIKEGDYLLYKNFKKVQEKFKKKSALSRKTKFILRNLSVTKVRQL